jgi:hypothetical protein
VNLEVDVVDRNEVIERLSERACGNQCLSHLGENTEVRDPKSEVRPEVRRQTRSHTCEKVPGIDA